MKLHNVSIIVTCQEQHTQLRQLLPQLFSLQYEGEFEVIVVDKMHDKDFAEWLEEMESRHPNLCHTFCPATARGINVHRLALTLGAKASAYEWLVILSADVVFPGDDWLSRFTACCGDEVDAVIGTTSRKHRWHRLTFNIFRHRFAIFKATSSIILCRRSILLQADNTIPKKRIIYLPL